MVTIGTVVKNLPAKARDVRDTASLPGSGRSLEEEMENQFRVLWWIIPWTEEPGGLQFVGSLGVGHNWATEHTCAQQSERGKRRSKGSYKIKSAGVGDDWPVLWKGGRLMQCCSFQPRMMEVSLTNVGKIMISSGDTGVWDGGRVVWIQKYKSKLETITEDVRKLEISWKKSTEG